MRMATSKLVSRISSRLGHLTLKPSKSSLASEVSQLKPTSCSPVPVSTRRVLRFPRYFNAFMIASFCLVTAAVLLGGCLWLSSTFVSPTT